VVNANNIQFGDVKEFQPEPELRPDENAQFVTRVVGDVDENELPIFVDLDVMRDMEAHAASDTKVELGGVMLGKQLLDQDGKPFVVVTESLRAEHYFATKGSFTFTHDTWSEITRRRSEFHPDLQMVGWYHTHPGWNVFLSGMDLFICDNFFNRPLDVALVIDPVNDDRGWFQWRGQGENEKSDKQTVRTGGFILMSGRHRMAELEYFANLYEKKPMSNDPRYASHFGGQGGHTVQIVESKRQDMVLLGMLAMQLVFMATIVYFLMADGGADSNESARDRQRETIRQEAQAELLAIVVAGQTGNAGLAEEFSKLKEQEYLLRKNIEGQLAVAENESLRRKHAEDRLQTASIATDRYKTDLVRLKQELAEAEAKLAKAAGGNEVMGDDQAAAYDWVWWLAGALGLLVIGGSGGYFWKASETRSPRRRIAFEDNADAFDDFAVETSDDVDFQDPVVPTQVG
jgi:proteasome lid subunit RPN8/RPN11